MTCQLTILDIALWLLWLLVSLAAFSVLWTGPLGAPWVPTARRTVRKMLALAEVGPGDVVYDLGAGDGRLLILAAQEFGARAVGIEIDPLRCLWIRLRVRALGLQDRVRVIRGNFFDQDLSEADVVVMYLMQKTNERLMHKFWRELRPNTRIVSRAFVFPGWEFAALDRDDHLYLYRMKEKPWEMVDGKRET